MMIGQVSKITGLTKRAIEYYTLQGLVYPSILDNGYKDYDEDDIDLLNKISVLRKLDIGTEEIKAILSDNSKEALKLISIRKELDFQRELVKRSILEKLIKGDSYSDVSVELQALDNSKAITEKLLEAFPGYYGQLICLNFSMYLNEPIKTKSQQEAYEKIVSFLDNIPPFILPEDLQEYLIEGTKNIGTEQIKDMLEDKKKSIEDMDSFLSSNRVMLEDYLKYKQSEEYKNSPACKIMELIKVFNSASGYYDTFIPALRKLSSSYSDYYRKMEIANEKLISQYPEIGEMYK